MHAPKPKEIFQSPGKCQNIKQILDNFEQTIDIKEKFIQHCHIGTDLKRQDFTEHMHCEIPLNTNFQI